MAIEFSISVPPSMTNISQLVEATNAWLSQLYTHDTPSTDKTAQVNLANYSSLTWADRAAFPNLPVASWGVKMLPGGGGFFFANYDDDTHVLVHIPNTAPVSVDS